MIVPKNVSEKGVKYSSIISGMASEGYGANKIAGWMRASGIGYEQNLMMKDIRQFRVQEQGAEAIRNLPKHITPPVDYVIKPNQTTIINRYAGVVTGNFKDNDSGEIVTLTRTFGFDSLMNKSQLINNFETAMRDNPSDPQFTFLSGNVEYIYKGLRK